jgi:hypothetical protein
MVKKEQREWKETEKGKYLKSNISCFHIETSPQCFKSATPAINAEKRTV